MKDREGSSFQCSMFFRFDTRHGQKGVYSVTMSWPYLGPNEITFLWEWGQSGWDVGLTTHLHLAPWIGMCNYICIYKILFRLSWCTQGQIYLDLYHFNFLEYLYIFCTYFLFLNCVLHVQASLQSLIKFYFKLIRLICLHCVSEYQPPLWQYRPHIVVPWRYLWRY